jgi:hypothetical protein
MKATKKERGDILRIKIKSLMEVQGDTGTAVKMAMLGGLRPEELLFAFCQEVCENPIGCSCKKLHVSDRSDGLSIIYINWLRTSKRIYFSIVPTRLWHRFRNQVIFGSSDIQAANRATKKAAGVSLSQLRQINHGVLQINMDRNQMAVFAGKAAPEAAQLCYEDIDCIIRRYWQAWEQFRVVLVAF